MRRPLARLSTKFDGGSALAILTGTMRGRRAGIRGWTASFRRSNRTSSKQCRAADKTLAASARWRALPQYLPHLSRPLRLFPHAATFGYLWNPLKMGSPDAYDPRGFAGSCNCNYETGSARSRGQLKVLSAVLSATGPCLICSRLFSGPQRPSKSAEK